MRISAGGAGGGEVEGVRLGLWRRRRDGVERPVVLRSSSSSDPSGGVDILRRLGGGCDVVVVDGVDVAVANFVEAFSFSHGSVRVMSVA